MKFVKIVVLFLLSTVLYGTTLKYQQQCGEYKYSITVDNPDEFYGNIIKFFFEMPSGKNKQFYQAKDMLIDAACTSSKNDSDMLIFREHCSGNACVETIYGLYDPRKENFLLLPKDWPYGNEKEVIKILGFAPEIFNFESDLTFCCNKQIGDYRNQRE
jgi:hypothetical protein